MLVTNSFPPLACFSHKATSANASANYVEFVFPFRVLSAIAQVRASAGTENMTGFDCDITTGTGQSTVKIAVTDLAENDVITLVVF